MKYLAEINIMPLKELLDPQGKTLLLTLPHIDIHAVQDVRVGKHITLLVEASDEEQAKSVVTEACEKLLANKVMEQYQFQIRSVD